MFRVMCCACMFRVAVDQQVRQVAVHVMHSTGLQRLQKLVNSCTGVHCGPEALQTNFVCVLQIGIEDFRVMTESFGMQLDDDSLLALFSRVMTHPSATLTCYGDCVSCVHCIGKHKVQKHATWCIQHQYFSSYCLALQQLTAIHDNTGPVRLCPRLW